MKIQEKQQNRKNTYIKWQSTGSNLVEKENQTQTKQ